MTKDEMQKVRDIISNFDRWEAKDLLQAVAILDAALAAPEQDPFAWATFDGEGSYDLRLYEDNENYLDEYRNMNGDKYAGWVIPLYTAPVPAPQDPRQAALEQVSRDCQWQASLDDKRDAERYRMARFKGTISDGWQESLDHWIALNAALAAMKEKP